MRKHVRRRRQQQQQQQQQRLSVYKAKWTTHSENTRQNVALLPEKPRVPKPLKSLLKCSSRNVIFTKMGFIFVFSVSIPKIAPVTRLLCALYFYTSTAYRCNRRSRRRHRPRRVRSTVSKRALPMIVQLHSASCHRKNPLAVIFGNS